MTADVFRGEQDIPGLINAFALSFTKERIVKVSYFIPFFGDVYDTWQTDCYTLTEWSTFSILPYNCAVWQTNDSLSNPRKLT